jgi:hypothetical protein
MVVGVCCDHPPCHIFAAAIVIIPCRFTHPFLPPTSAPIPFLLHPQLQPISISIPFAESADAKIACCFALKWFFFPFYNISKKSSGKDHTKNNGEKSESMKLWILLLLLSH